MLTPQPETDESLVRFSQCGFLDARLTNGIRGAAAAAALSVCFLGVLALAACNRPDEQAPTTSDVHRVAFLMPTRSDAEFDAEGLPIQAPPLRAFRRGLAEVGYVEGKDVKVQYHFTVEGDEAKLPAIAGLIVDSNPNVIVAIGPDETRAVKNATDSIPIVFAAVADPGCAGGPRRRSHRGVVHAGVERVRHDEGEAMA
jgi:hypothetical protein